jgi:asparagine synthetase B (glutamine-hydrolysing)
MALDLDRIWHRNMGRDDRAISSNGKEARFPFLDLQVQHFLRDQAPDSLLIDGLEQNAWFNADLQRGTGDKRLLRMYASEVLGIQAGSFEKRAIQFGTKIAKQTNVATFGSNRKANGKA